jgi:hypothetical protein
MAQVKPGKPEEVEQIDLFEDEEEQKKTRELAAELMR